MQWRIWILQLRRYEQKKELYIILKPEDLWWIVLLQWNESMLFKSLQFSSSCEYSACFDAHLIAQALLVFVMRIKNWFDFEREVILCNFAGRKVAQDHFPFTTRCTVISSSPGWGVMWTGVNTLSPLMIMVRVIWRLLLMLCAGFILEVQHWLLSLSHV